MTKPAIREKMDALVEVGLGVEPPRHAVAAPMQQINHRINLRRSIVTRRQINVQIADVRVAGRVVFEDFAFVLENNDNTLLLRIFSHNIDFLAIIAKD